MVFLKIFSYLLFWVGKLFFICPTIFKKVENKIFRFIYIYIYIYISVYIFRSCLYIMKGFFFSFMLILFLSIF